MKTLKKVLCLVLALVMVVGTMAISAAAFTDDETIANKDAAAVLNGIGVLKGYEDGSFGPSKTLTRAEGAVIIARLLQMDDLDLKSSFSDMAGYDWADSAVAYLASQGIVAGVGDNKFNPAGTLTGAQFARMLLSAVGYSAENEGFLGDGWDGKVATLAKTTGISYKGVALSGAITREQAAQFAFNALKVSKVYYHGGTQVSSNGMTVTTGASIGYYNETLADDFKLELTPAKGVVTANSANAKTEKTTVGGTQYDVKTGTEVLYHFVKVYTADNKVVALLDAGKVVTIATALSNKKNDVKAAFGDAVAEKNPTYGEVLSFEAGNAAAGVYTVNDENVIVAYNPFNSYIASKVGETGTTTKKLTLAGVELNDNTVLNGDVKKDDIVVVEVVNNTIYNAKAAETVTGKISKINGDKITVNGTVYDLSTIADYSGLADDDKDFTNEFKLYLDNTGKYFALKKVTDAPVDGDLVYILDKWTVSNNTTTGNEWGGEATSDGKSRIQYVDVATGTVKMYEGKTTDLNDFNVGFARFVVGSNGAITLKALKSGEFAETGNVAANKTKISDGSVTAYIASDAKMIVVSSFAGTADARKNRSAEVKAVAETKDNGARYLYTTIPNSTNKTTSVIIVDKDSLASAPVVAKVAFANETANAAAVPYTENGQTMTGYEHTIYVDGVKTTIITTKADALNGFITYETATNPALTITGAYSAPANVVVVAKETVTNNVYSQVTAGGDTDINLSGAKFVNLTTDAKNDITAVADLRIGTEISYTRAANGTPAVVYITASPAAVA